MKITELSQGIFQLSINVENLLFEELWEIPRGASLNSYIVKGEKTAIIDGFCGWDGIPETLYELLSQMDLSPNDIDYVIINHMEPDHSGWIETFSKMNDHFKVVCGEKAAELLEAFYEHTDRVTVVNDETRIDLGAGKMLKFLETPFVHWPDTIVTYEESSETLFACDLFGSFGIIGDSPFNGDQSPESMEVFYEETVRYFSNILGAYSLFVTKAVDKIQSLSLKTIAPGHGLIYNTQPQLILDQYRTLAQYAKNCNTKEVTLIWGSMYGMTEKAVHFLNRIFEEHQIKTHIHRVPETSWGTILKSAWTSKAIVLAMPTYEYKMFPPMCAVLEELGSKKVTERLAFRVGSYGWSGGAQKELDELMIRKKMKWHFIDSVEFKGSPKDEDFTLMREQALKLIDQLNAQ